MEKKPIQITSYDQMIKVFGEPRVANLVNKLELTIKALGKQCLFNTNEPTSEGGTEETSLIDLLTMWKSLLSETDDRPSRVRVKPNRGFLSVKTADGALYDFVRNHKGQLSGYTAPDAPVSLGFFTGRKAVRRAARNALRRLKDSGAFVKGMYVDVMTDFYPSFIGQGDTSPSMVVSTTFEYDPNFLRIYKPDTISTGNIT